MRALVISGGGAKGAFAGGYAQYLINERGREYDVFIGSSTGSLMVTHLALGKLDVLKRAYTTVTQNNVFDVSPFRVVEKEGTLKARMDHWNIVWQFIKGKKTFGESQALRKLIQNNITEQDFEEVRRLPKKIVVTVSNLTLNKVEYKYLSDCSYQDFLDWVWFSCNMVPFMSLASKDGYQYADGGFGNLVPVQEAIACGATEIDAIVLSPRNLQMKKEKSKNAFDVLLSTFDFMLHQIRKDDLFLGHLEGIYGNVKVHFHHTPYLLTDNSFLFNPVEMQQWWELGFRTARERDGDARTPRTL